MNQWPNMISDLREKGLTQTQIGTEIGCSQNYVSDLERGYVVNAYRMKLQPNYKSFGKSIAKPNKWLR